MKPETKIQATILLKAAKNGDAEIPDNLISLTDDEISEIYYDLEARCDYEQDFREGQVETGLKCDWSRHYESKSVAAKMFDGSWVGWTYWYGGGKHSEAEAIDWMSYSYDLDCVEKEEMVINRYFTKIENEIQDN